MTSRTGYVYDDAVNAHCFPLDTAHVEGPPRTRIAHAHLVASGTLDKTVHVTSRSATIDEIRLVHTEGHVVEVQNYSSEDPYVACTIRETYDTYVCDATFASASRASGCLLALADNVCSGNLTNGFALIRPPGHHADESSSNGFCYFNNIAIAAKYAQSKYTNVSKVAIVDWDVHLGNGIQDIFYSDPSVLYISLHRHDGGNFYPHLEKGNYDAVGEAKGMGYNINIAWNGQMMGNAEYRAAFEDVIQPVLRQYGPDLVLVASGFDAADGDPLGQYKVTPQMYGWMTRQLMEFAEGRVVVCLEGGYNCEVVGECAKNVIEGLTGSDVIEAPPGKSCERACDTLKEVRSAHAQFWTFT